MALRPFESKAMQNSSNRNPNERTGLNHISVLLNRIFEKYGIDPLTEEEMNPALSTSPATQKGFVVTQQDSLPVTVGPSTQTTFPWFQPNAV